MPVGVVMLGGIGGTPQTLRVSKTRRVSPCSALSSADPDAHVVGGGEAESVEVAGFAGVDVCARAGVGFGLPGAFAIDAYDHNVGQAFTLLVRSRVRLRK